MSQNWMCRVDARERWSSRSMIVKRWFVKEVFDPDAGPICEIETDGVSRSQSGQDLRLYHNRPAGQPDFGMIRRFYVQEGSEIGPTGNLFEFVGTSRMGDTPGTRGAPLHTSAKLRLTRRERYPLIFLNYRRDDADAYAGRLHEVFMQEFGEDEVFLAEFSIRPGEAWNWTIQQAVVHARVMVTLIGRRWLALSDGDKRRIDLPHDIVRREIVGAMDRGITVVPVLLPEATIPRADDFDLDDELAFLPQLQFHKLAAVRHWKADVKALIDTLRQHLQCPPLS
jgi:hypothetical protein